MPRRNSPVKSKGRISKSQILARSAGAVDIHFHGAFGIDLMAADFSQLDDLSQRLAQLGVAAFCPTTLSTTPSELAAAVERLGKWIVRTRKSSKSAPVAAIPLGIHLEGPYINSSCCGAHPPDLIRPFQMAELKKLWQLSQGTLKILTLAPETLPPSERKELLTWAKENQVVLSIGHSKATEKQADQAFQEGFRGITHAWNALPFHQRAPGALASAFKNAKSYVEIIIDQVHVAPSVIRWTEDLQPADRLCYVSDCVPAAATEENKICGFGPLKIRYQEGACRLENGALAGGGKILTQSFAEWIEFVVKTEISAKTPSKSVISKEIFRALKQRLPSISTAPLKALGLKPTLLGKSKIIWTLTPEGRLQASPLK